MKREFKLIGELPEGDWQFCLVVIEKQLDVIVVVDRSGNSAPRMIVDGKLRTITV